jgi:hypothetical protein
MTAFTNDESLELLHLLTLLGAIIGMPEDHEADNYKLTAIKIIQFKEKLHASLENRL